MELLVVEGAMVWGIKLAGLEVGVEMLVGGCREVGVWLGMGVD